MTFLRRQSAHNTALPGPENVSISSVATFGQDSDRHRGSDRVSTVQQDFR